jgi:hypothetical protein
LKVLLRYLGALVVLLIGVMAVSYLQYRFDQSDIQHAVGAVRQARPPGLAGKTIEEGVASYYQIAPEAISWVPEIQSKLKGTVLVKALPPQGPGKFIWQVDLVHFSIQPMSPEAEGLSKTGH